MSRLKVVWTNTWYDPAKEQDAGKSLIEAGADVIAQHQDTPGPMQAAEAAGVYGISYHSDMSKFAPECRPHRSGLGLGSPTMVKTVQSVMDKTWKSEQYWGIHG